jgi:hypothetical protein
MKQIIHLKNFKELKLWIEFIDDLKAIAIHCNQLKSFEINVIRINTAVNKQIFNSSKGRKLASFSAHIWRVTLSAL